MSKGNRVKRKISVWERKLKSLENKYESERINKSEFDKFAEILQQKEEKNYELQVFKTKIKLAIKKSKQLQKEFKSKSSQYATRQEFKKAYHLNKIKRTQAIKDLKAEYKKLYLAYCYEYETFSYKMKRWFFGMGKEFNRIHWLSGKLTLRNFGIIVPIILILSTIFFIIDILFSLFI